MSSLQLRFEPDPADEVGKLWMTVLTERFTGTGFYWSYREGVKGLADKLGEYPLSEPASADWTEADNVMLALQIAPVGKLGDLTVSVEIADLHDAQQRLSVSFATSYAELSCFRQQLVALTEGTSDQAILTGD